MNRSLAVSENNGLTTRFGEKYGIEPNKMLSTLKATAFKQSDNRPITNEQMCALMVVCEKYDLNPFVKQVYAYPEKNGGIVPIIGIDGWDHIINKQPQMDGISFECSEDWIKMDEHSANCPSWIKAIIYRKDRSHPIEVTEYLDENYRAPFKKNNYTVRGPWQTHTKRMLRHKALKECARIAFGLSGIYDEDEGKDVYNQNNSGPVELEQSDLEVVDAELVDTEPEAKPELPKKRRAKKQKPEPEQEPEEHASLEVPEDVQNLDIDI